MPVLRRSTNQTVSSNHKSVAKRKTTSTISSSSTRPPRVFPTEPTLPADFLSAYPFLIYGDQGVGKTSLFLQYPKSFGLFFEPGTVGLTRMGFDIEDWEDFIGILTQLEEGEHEKYSSFIVDTVEVAHSMLRKHIEAREGMPIKDIPYGLGWNMWDDEYTNAFDRLNKLAIRNGKAVCFVSHREIKSINLSSGRMVNRLEYAASERAMNCLTGIIRIIGYYGFIEEERYLWIRGNDFRVGKCSADDNFKTISGQDVYAIPMGTSKETAYKNLVRAFENKQKNTYKDIEPEYKEKKQFVRK